MSAVLNPTLPVAIKLGSIARHVEELLSPDAHDVDRLAIESLLADPDLQAWMAEMDAVALLPVPRNDPGARR